MYLHMYVPTYVCTYICMYLHMYVPTYVCTYICMYLLKNWDILVWKYKPSAKSGSKTNKIFISSQIRLVCLSVLFLLPMYVPTRYATWFWQKACYQIFIRNIYAKSGKKSGLTKAFHLSGLAKYKTFYFTINWMIIISVGVK
jgi:hypothetical protein